MDFHLKSLGYTGNNKKKSLVMDSKTIDQLLEALVEDYTWEELQDGDFMMTEMNSLLGVNLKEAEALLAGAREIKRLRRYIIPDWKQLLVMH